MKLFVNKGLDDKPSVKALELLSTEFATASFIINDTDIPLIVFTDTSESFFINQISEKLSRINSDTLLTIELADIVAAGSGGVEIANGFLKTFDDSIINTTFKRVSDAAGNLSGLYLTTKGITNFAGTPPVNENVAFGVGPLLNLNATSSSNTAVGHLALSTVVNSNYNTAFGVEALKTYNDPSGSPSRGLNTALGAYAGNNLTTGAFNTNVGGISNTNGTVGDYNVSVGYGAMNNNTSGMRNVALGSLALQGRVAPVTGSDNIAIGFQAGRAVSSGSRNILLEITTIDGVTTGNNNIILNPVNNTGITTGSNNVVIGGVTGLANGSDRVILATGAGVQRCSFDSAGQMTINTSPTLGTGAATERLLVRDTAAGAIKSIEYVTTNATASALSAATLNATYPNATLGFRVICMSIAGGALVYTKTGASSWGSQSITATA